MKDVVFFVRDSPDVFAVLKLQPPRWEKMLAMNWESGEPGDFFMLEKTTGTQRESCFIFRGYKLFHPHFKGLKPPCIFVYGVLVSKGSGVIGHSSISQCCFFSQEVVRFRGVWTDFCLKEHPKKIVRYIRTLPKDLAQNDFLLSTSCKSPFTINPHHLGNMCMLFSNHPKSTILWVIG